MRRNSTKKLSAIAILLLVLVLLASGISGAAAYLSITANKLTYSFSVASDPTTAVESDFSIDPGTGNYQVYVRAAVTVNWVTNDGQILATTPEAGKDYTLTVAENWFEHDGFYYYKLPVSNANANAVSSPVTVERKTTKTDCTLTLELATQTIQALGTTDEKSVPAITDAWGINIGTDTKLIDPS